MYLSRAQVSYAAFSHVFVYELRNIVVLVDANDLFTGFRACT